MRSKQPLESENIRSWLAEIFIQKIKMKHKNEHIQYKQSMCVFHYIVSYINLLVKAAELSLFSLCFHSTTHTAKGHWRLRIYCDVFTKNLIFRAKKNPTRSWTQTCTLHTDRSFICHLGMAVSGGSRQVRWKAWGQPSQQMSSPPSLHTAHSSSL